MSRKFFDFIHRLYPRSFRSKLAYLLGISRLFHTTNSRQFPVLTRISKPLYVAI
jgi:hypothetical protein